VSNLHGAAYRCVSDDCCAAMYVCWQNLSRAISKARLMGRLIQLWCTIPGDKTLLTAKRQWSI